MEKIRLKNALHPLYPAFASLYGESFPVFEQRTARQQQAAFSCPEYHLDVFREKGDFAGFIAWWDFPGYIYVEHFAVAKSLRGGGYGRWILEDMAARTPKRMLLEIDPVADEVSEARLRFYLRRGFSVNGFPHVHPPYRSGYGAHPLVVLSSGGEITGELYIEFSQDLSVRVMGGG